MAYMVPESIPGSATAGERLLFGSLRDNLPGDYIVYYKPEIWGSRPDYVLIGPDLGFLVLEVNEYAKNAILKVGRGEWTVRDGAGEAVRRPNPLRQAQDKAGTIEHELKKEPNLLRQGRRQLKFPYGSGAVFARLRKEELLRGGLDEAIEP